MLEIKFQHAYRKLLGANGKPIENAVLLQTGALSRKDMSDIFFNYDTDKGKYPLPDGIYIMLLFAKLEKPKTAGSNLFTTMRRFTEEKAEYYLKNVGQTFKVTIAQ